MIKIEIGPTVLIYNLPLPLKKQIKKRLTLSNPLYYRMLRSAERDPRKKKALYTIPPTFEYFSEASDVLIVWRGVLSLVKKFFDLNDIKYELKDYTCATKADNKIPKIINPREYQVGDITKILKEPTGIIKLGTAYGKTITAFRLVEKTQLKTLIICCKAELSEVDKYRNDYIKFYNKKIGELNTKKQDIKDITVSNISSLLKLDLTKYEKEFGMVIVDECHVSVSDKRRKAIQSFRPKLFYGMSGTPDRDNEQGEAIKFMYGPILIEKKLDQAKPTVQVYTLDFEYPGSEYHEMEEKVVETKLRNWFIADLTGHLVRKDKRRVLILTKRVEHSKILADILEKYIKIKPKLILSSEKASERSGLIERLRQEEEDFEVILGTYSLLSTGVDIPRLDTLIMAMSIKADCQVSIVQSIGRILRLHDKKKTPMIIDMDDTGNAIMHNHYLGRRKFYKQNGWEIKIN